MSEYADRDIIALDKDGGHYCRHVQAMTAEKLHDKSDIAAELGWRDQQIEWLRAEREALREANGHLHGQTNKLGEQILLLRADAERYRWLRSSHRVARWDVKYWTGEFWDVMYGIAMDEQIDAARAAKERG